MAEGKLYYDTGELYFEGTYDDSDWNNLKPWKPTNLIEGIEYYRNGHKYREGRFQKAGLLKGREYYPSGGLKFEGQFNDKAHGHGSYYGPSYPVYGCFYGEDGTLLYEGRFTVRGMGGCGYPRVEIPEGFGSLK